MGKTLRRYLVREILLGVLSGLALFTFILLVARLLELVDLVMARGVPAGQVLQLLTYILPSFLEIAIPISLLLGVIVAFARLSSDGECLAMRAAGVSVWQLVGPVVSVGCLAAAVTLFVAGWARPWALVQAERTLYEIAKSRATAAIRPAMFNLIADGVVLYAERIDHTAGRLDGILLSDERETGTHTTVFAGTAEISTDEAERDMFLRLRNGTSVTFHSGRDSYDTTVFSSLEFHLNLTAALQGVSEAGRPLALRYPGELLAERRALSARGMSAVEPSLELHRRAAFAVGAFLLTLMGIPLGIQPSRSVRARGLAVSIVIALAYHVLMTVSVTLARRDVVGPASAMWMPNGILALGTLLMLLRSAADRTPYPVIGSLRGRATNRRVSR